MLDLQAGVHLHEPDAVGAQAFGGVGDELDRAGPDIAHRLSRLHGGGADSGAGGLVHAGGRSLLDDLLVAALQRAIALEQVDDIAVAVAEHLHLDVARTGDVLLQQHPVVAEAGGGLAAARAQGGLEVAGLVDLAHALAAAAGHGLDQHRIADLAGLGRQALDRLVLAQIARRGRHAGLDHDLLGGVLQAHGADRRGRRADPDQTGVDHRSGRSRRSRTGSHSRGGWTPPPSAWPPPGSSSDRDSSPWPAPGRSGSRRRPPSRTARWRPPRNRRRSSARPAHGRCG
jgi:hypothetical protein